MVMVIIIGTDNSRLFHLSRPNSSPPPTGNYGNGDYDRALIGNDSSVGEANVFRKA